jgi:hypothetical protein
MSEEECASSGVVKLAVVVALNTLVGVANWVETKEKKLARVENVSDLNLRGSIQVK